MRRFTPTAATAQAQPCKCLLLGCCCGRGLSPLYKQVSVGSHSLMLFAAETGKHPVERLAPGPATLQLCCARGAWIPVCLRQLPGSPVPQVCLRRVTPQPHSPLRPVLPHRPCGRCLHRCGHVDGWLGFGHTWAQQAVWAGTARGTARAPAPGGVAGCPEGGLGVGSLEEVPPLNFPQPRSWLLQMSGTGLDY